MLLSQQTWQIKHQLFISTLWLRLHLLDMHRSQRNRRNQLGPRVSAGQFNLLRHGQHHQVPKIRCSSVPGLLRTPSTDGLVSAGLTRSHLVSPAIPRGVLVGQYHLRHPHQASQQHGVIPDPCLVLCIDQRGSGSSNVLGCFRRFPFCWGGSGFESYSCSRNG